MTRMTDGVSESPAGSDGATRILVITALYPPAFKGGGPIRTLEAMVRSAPSDLVVAVVAGDRDLASPSRLRVPLNRWTSGKGADCYYVSVDRPLQVARLFFAIARWRPDVLYLNSFFSPVFGILPRLLRRMGWCGAARVVQAPRGEFSDGALALKGYKKRTFIALYRLSKMARGVTWHASTSNEANDIAKVIGSAAEIVVREDETSLPMEPDPPTHSGSATTLRLVFLSRISPMKGLHTLIAALGDLHCKVDLDVYGPETDGNYARLCRESASGLPANVIVRFCGVVDNTEARRIFSGYDAFAFPTAGENFGHVIAEALSVSCPVICTDRTPWTKRLQSGGGVVVTNARSVSAWTNALHTYSELTLDQRVARRHLAGAAYRDWMNEGKGMHVFDVVRQESNRLNRFSVPSSEPTQSS